MAIAMAMAGTIAIIFFSVFIRLAHGFRDFFPQFNIFGTEAHIGDEFLAVRGGDFEFKNGAFLDAFSDDCV